jgi:hypothetical protein
VKIRARAVKCYVVERLANTEHLQAHAAAGVPDLDGPVARRRREPPRVGRECDRADRVTVALERLKARAAAGVPDLDYAVARRRRELR